MVRVVKDAEVRKNEILDVAQKLFYGKGYERTSIQDIIGELGIAKGTFYHHFRSKNELLDALIERMFSVALRVIEEKVEGEGLAAPERFARLFAEIGIWKLQNKPFFEDLLHVMYKDENLILRHKMRVKSIGLMVPTMSGIIRQGMAEGVFAVEHPDEVSEMILRMVSDLGDAIATLLLSTGKGPELVSVVERKTEVYERSIERVLGAPAGTLNVFDRETTRAWLT